MKPRLWSYFLRQALKSIWSNRMVHALGLGTMVASLLIFGTFLLLFVNISSWLEGWGSSLSMSVYLADDIRPNDRQSLISFVKNLGNCSIDRIISKDEAVRTLKRSLGSQSGLLEGLPKDVLPASVELHFNPKASGSDPAEVKKVLESMAGVEEVQYTEDWIERFQGIIKFVKLAGYTVAGLLGLAVLFIVTNTIKMTIYSRKEEIEIMKMVGATDGFVKLPFVLEGMFLGGLSGALAIAVLFGGYSLLSMQHIPFLDLALLDVVFLPKEYSAVLFLISIGLGFFGSLIAVGRFFDL